MTIGIIDVDGHCWPNLALMKLSEILKNMWGVINRADQPPRAIAYKAGMMP